MKKKIGRPKSASKMVRFSIQIPIELKAAWCAAIGEKEVKKMLVEYLKTTNLSGQ